MLHGDLLSTQSVSPPAATSVPSPTAAFSAPALTPAPDFLADAERGLTRVGVIVAAVGAGQMAITSVMSVMLLSGMFDGMFVRVRFGLEVALFVLGVAAVTRHDMARRHLKKAVAVMYVNFLYAALAIWGVSLTADEVIGTSLAWSAAWHSVAAIMGVIATFELRRVDLRTFAWTPGWPVLGVIGLASYLVLAGFVFMSLWMRW